MDPLPSDPEGSVGTPSLSGPSCMPHIGRRVVPQEPQADCTRVTGEGGDSGLPDTGMGPLQTNAGALSPDSGW